MTEQTTETTNGTSGAKWDDARIASEQATTADPRIEKSKPYRATFALPLSDAEKLWAGAELANGLERVETLRGEKKAAAEAVQEKIDAELSSMGTLASELRSGKREQEVEVIAASIFELGVVRILLAETGEVISERPMQQAERQRSLDVAQPATPEVFAGVHDLNEFAPPVEVAPDDPTAIDAMAMPLVNLADEGAATKKGRKRATKVQP